MTTYMCRVPDHLKTRTFTVRGVNVHDIQSGKILGQLERAFQLPELSNLPRLNALLQNLSGVGTAAAVLNLGVSVASFAYMRSQFERTHQKLNAIAQKLEAMDQKLSALEALGQDIRRGVGEVGVAVVALAKRADRRRHDDAFAEIGAVLDALTYADGLPEDASRSVITANLVPLNKAVRLFHAYVDELEGELEETAVERLETARLRAMAASVLIKTDLLLGRGDQAERHAQGLHDLVQRLIGRQLSRIGKELFRGCSDEAAVVALAQFVAGCTGVPVESVLAGPLLKTSTKADRDPSQALAFSEWQQALIGSGEFAGLKAGCGFEIGCMFAALEKNGAHKSINDLSWFGIKRGTELMHRVLAELGPEARVRYRTRVVGEGIINEWKRVSHMSPLPGVRFEQGDEFRLEFGPGEAYRLELTSAGYVLGVDDDGSAAETGLASMRRALRLHLLVAEEAPTTGPDAVSVLAAMQQLLELSRGILLETVLAVEAKGSFAQLATHIASPLQEALVLVREP